MVLILDWHLRGLGAKMWLSNQLAPLEIRKNETKHDDQQTQTKNQTLAMDDGVAIYWRGYRNYQESA